MMALFEGTASEKNVNRHGTNSILDLFSWVSLTNLDDSSMNQMFHLKKMLIESWSDFKEMSTHRTMHKSRTMGQRISIEREHRKIHHSCLPSKSWEKKVQEDMMQNRAKTTVGTSFLNGVSGAEIVLAVIQFLNTTRSNFQIFTTYDLDLLNK